MTGQPTAQTVAEQLSTLVGQVRQHQSTVGFLSTSQIMAGRRRARLRVPGSSRHLSEVITARRGPAGMVSHTRVAGAICGNPTHALDEVLVLAIVQACHDLCGIPITDTDTRRWRQLVRHAAAHSAHQAARTA